MRKVVTNRSKFPLIILMMGLISQPLFAQESILKEFVENSNKRKFCFYPSTLRMVNLQQDPAFNEMIAPIEKLLLYSLDSSSIASKEYRYVLDDYTQEGYEDYAQVYGGKFDIHVLGKERKVREWVGVLKQGDEAFAFYLIGAVNWQKIPHLMNSIQENDLFTLVDLGNNGGNWD